MLTYEVGGHPDAVDSHGDPDLEGGGLDGENDRAEEDEGQRHDSGAQHHAQPDIIKLIIRLIVPTRLGQLHE